MPLLSEVKYESGIEDLWDISPAKVPEKVLAMLKDIKEEISKLDPFFITLDFGTVLKIVEKGSYKINRNIATKIDLSSAQAIIETYREYSEGGCQSCVKLGQETIDAQDGSSGHYCEVSDPQYNPNHYGGQLGVTVSGFSRKVHQHYQKPCDDWKPRFTPKLEVLIKSA